MDNLIGYPLKDALNIIEQTGIKIVNIKKVTGTNKRFNDLSKPYVIRQYMRENHVTLFISYF